MSTSIPDTRITLSPSLSPASAPITSPALSSTIPTSTSYSDIPLTTTFTPPLDCSGIYETGGLAVVDVQTSCLPSGFRTPEAAHFSPGIICPSGYWSACHNTRSHSLTTVTCCPFRDDISLSCADPATLSDAFQNMYCTWMAPLSPGTKVAITVTEEGKSSTVTRLMANDTAATVPGAMGIAAYGVRMVHQSADLLLLPSEIGSPAVTESPSSPPKPTPPFAATPWIIGLAISIPLAVVAVLVVSYFWWNRRVQRYRQVSSNPAVLHEFPLDPYPYKPGLPSDTHAYPEQLLDSHRKHSKFALGSTARSL
ncbi:hypothetical protein V8F06_001991 [Rhypophila decipiens]